MHLISRLDFSAPPDRVFAMVTDETFLAHAATELGSADPRVAASATRTAVEGAIETPAEIRAFVGPSLTITQETVWSGPAPDGSREGTVTLTVATTPVSLTGTATLAPAPGGSTLTYSGDLVVKVPLLGGRLETLAAPIVTEAFEAQGRVGADWLATHQ